MRPRAPAHIAVHRHEPILVLLLGYTLACHASSVPRGNFDSAAAEATVRRAATLALSDCEGRAGPGGPGQVEVELESSGTANHIRVLPVGLGSSARGACIERVLRFEVSVPPFDGPPGTVQQLLEALAVRPPESIYPRVSAATRQAGGIDLAAAVVAITRAAREVSAQCDLPGGPRGTGRVELTFGNDGRVRSTELHTTQFRDTPVGACIQQVFGLVSVTPFRGRASPLIKSFRVGSGPEPASDHDYEAAAQALANHPPAFDAKAAARALNEAASAAGTCPATDAWGWGEAELDFTNLGFVDHAALLSERFEGSKTGNCVANEFRRVEIPVFSGPSPSLVQDFEVQPSRRFDEEKARQALEAAAKLAAFCSGKSNPKGPLEVGVRFGSDGHVTRALVLTPAFRGSPQGSCVEMVFRRAIVPTFEGPAPPLFQRLAPL
jgi:hypothetical protein